MLDEGVRELRDREDEDEVEEELERRRPLLLAVARLAQEAPHRPTRVRAVTCTPPP